MPGSAVKNFNINIILSLFLLLFIAVFIMTIFNEEKKSKPAPISGCDGNFHFEEFNEIDNADKEVKSTSDYFLSELISLNGMGSLDGFCAAAIEGRANCIQYFQPKSAVGGDVRICVNPKAKTLSSAEFGE